MFTSKGLAGAFSGAFCSDYLKEVLIQRAAQLFAWVYLVPIMGATTTQPDSFAVNDLYGLGCSKCKHYKIMS